MTYFICRMALIRKLHGTAKLFAVVETICFPVSVLTVFVVAVSAVTTLAGTVLASLGFCFPVFVLPDGVTFVSVSAAVGYITNYVAIQMLYYPVSANDLRVFPQLDGKVQGVEHALKRSRVISLVTLGFWTKGLIPRNRQKVAWQIGLVAEERFVTPEAVVRFLPKITNVLLSKNAEGKVLVVELMRKLVLANRDAAAAIMRDLIVGFVKHGDKSTIRDFVAKIGKSEVVATALTKATLDYTKDHPEKIVFIVREMVSAFTQDLVKSQDPDEELDFGNSSIFAILAHTVEGVSAVAKGVAAAALEGVSDAMLLPRVEKFLKECDTPERKEIVQNVLGGFLPIIFDKIGENITSDPKILDVVISGDVIDKLVNVKFDDEAFWNGLGEKMAPRLEAPINEALRGMTKEQFASFFGAGHLVAENVRDTIMQMPLLDFYSMLDEVMAEHLGAIQVFGFVLGALVGYIQYSIVLLREGFYVVPCLMLLIPVVAICGFKLFHVGSRGKEKTGAMNGTPIE